jgi:hypothetical protein
MQFLKMSTNTEYIDCKSSLDSNKYQVNDDILFRQVENEGILLHIPSRTYYSLSETSIMFWQALSNSQPLTPIIEQIIEEYDLEESLVIQDLKSFLQDLLDSGVIVKIG